MTMVIRRWLALMLGAGLLASAERASASDVVRLGGSAGPALADTHTLASNGDDADTQFIYHRGGYGGGYRGGYGGYSGYRGGYGGYSGARFSVNIGYGGYRSYYRPYYHGSYYSYYRPYYRPYYSSYYSGYYAPSYSSYYPSYYSPSYYSPSYYYPSYYSPCASEVVVSAPVVTLRAATGTYAPSYVPPTYSPTPVTPRAMPPVDGAIEGPDGSYRYDGGPSAPMPLPLETPAAPTVDPKRPMVPRDGRFVSLPSPTPRVAYPAYGEATPTRRTAAGTLYVSTTAPATTTRINYPAYGEGK
jgi:hypothetical protein